MRNRYLLTCLFLVTLMPLSAKTAPPPSPAGGNYLELDGVDDYAVLDFDTFGRLLPAGAEEFTVEAWIYPTKPPDSKDTSATILHQQVRMVIDRDDSPWAPDAAKLNLLNIDPPKGDFILRMHAYIEGGFGNTLYFPVSLEPNRWHHIAYQSKGQEITTIVNDFARTLQHGLPLGHELLGTFPKDFVLGGFGQAVEIPLKVKQFYDSFTGYIDEVRISTVARYEVDKKDFMPHGAFEHDAKTVALWHFDEPGGAVEFSDASDNLHHLVGQNGAKTGTPLAVEAHGKLATAWGRLKE